MSDDVKCITPHSKDKTVEKIIYTTKELYDEYVSIEDRENIVTGTECDIHYDLTDYCADWCDCENVEDCKRLLQSLEYEKQIFLGEFVKALMKINNIACEMEKIAELTGRIDFLSTLREIPRLTMKYVVTNQSLYI